MAASVRTARRKKAPPTGRAGGGRPRAKPPPVRPRRRWLPWGLKWLAVTAIWSGVGLAALLVWYGYDLPDIDDALTTDRRPTITLAAADGTVVATRGDRFAGAVRVEDLPPHLPRAILATEDRRFYDHFGVDPVGLARAVVANVSAGRVVQGGSTLTQQVAKNLFLSPERSLRRKVQELLLALWLERRFTKDQIFTIYLNRVYLGAGTYGVEAAARTYFDKPAARLGLAESAMVAGLLKAPSRYNPRANRKLAIARATQVLANMVDARMLTPEAAARAEADLPRVVRRRGPGNRAGHFGDWVMTRLAGYSGAETGDRTVITTLDRDLQAAAEAAVARRMAEGRKRGAGQAAVVVMDGDGAVRALVGGVDYRDSQFNRATGARRQPGSAFKPFVYLAALEAGMTPDTVIEDAPISVDGWSPANWDGRYRGPIPLTEALARSVNTVAVRVARRVGPGRVAATAERLGITGDLPRDLSLALGSAEVTLIDLVTAYVPIANGGYGVFPHAILEVRDRDGRTVYRRRGGGPGRVAEAAHVVALRGMLAEVIRSGTGRAADIGRPAGGKTGTSQDHRDAWFVGYAGNLVAGVWVGNDDGRPMKRVGGGGLPARIWRDILAPAGSGEAPVIEVIAAPDRTPAPAGDLLDRLRALFD